MVSRRVIRSYEVRYGLGANKATMNDLTDAIDIHAHARGDDEEEPLHAAQEASRAGMQAIVFRSWDELSPLLGVDPQDMVAAIRAVGPESFMLSSDAGIPLLPQTVEACRLLAATLRAYGMTGREMRQLMTGSAKETLALAA